jgi:hypothetical protein
VALVPSWLALGDRAVADDHRLRVDVCFRKAHVPELLVWMLQGHAQRRAIVMSETARESRHAYAARLPEALLALSAFVRVFDRRGTNIGTDSR